MNAIRAPKPGHHHGHYAHAVDNHNPDDGAKTMKTKFVEAYSDGLWLKVAVATYEPAETSYTSRTPGAEGLNLIRHAGRATPDDVWILDLSTGEGAKFLLNQGPEHQLRDISANL